MTIQDRRTREKQELTDKILETAIRLAEESDWSHVSIRNISERIQYSSIMIYSLFGSKENLFAELKKLGFSKLLKDYQSMDTGSSDGKATVISLTEATVKFYFENRQLYQIMFGVIGLAGVSQTCGEESVPNQVAQFIKRILSQAVEGDIDSVFFQWWALVHGFISIGSTMPEERFRQILPHLDAALRKFMT